ncbi:PREDICTED: sacsin-like isoform X2 [Amphimedon queenslandica]|uniref:Death domain-containing protein n=1 Tax=Amphimedon queenslandica TaxID=400682 RepID=A0AAN0JT49_AMPQE|nr:PREDICTED: sacsin-like isoform X2 [Amphimedon queenslandica]|eukprot:XP_019860001.1 PREDICTED: sacsin-like isoform X2 [Amphimedon queenslandica]
MTSERASELSMELPLHGLLDIEDLDYVLGLLKQCPFSFGNWKGFGSALGLDEVTLTDIQSRNNSSDCNMKECLSKWLKKADYVKHKGVPTLGRLSDALEEIDENSAADYIRRNGSSYVDDLLGESFGQKRPPLYEMIRNILREYPSGQIFKEIIQNADDARATEVKFYLDCRVLQTLPPSLISSASDAKHQLLLKEFKGPALLSYNNAPFREEDWKSIQSLQQSGKAKNPHKVGKFGIGFNSVYHITDLPVILSQNYCGFLEPQERVWKGESGKGFFLKSLKNNCQEALEPFDGICGFSKHNPSYQDKTLFRFPLRNKESNLSSDVYTIDKLHSLLHTLQEEAQYLLVFLRSVCSIEICKITESNDTVSLFKVSVSQKDFQSRLSQQRKLLSDVESTFIGDSKYCIRDIIIDASCFNVEKVDASVVSNYNWLVVDQIGSDDNDVMQLAEKQHILPWVGAAINLEDPIRNGRIFCILPLPVENQAPFHVHVNGTFAISSNRRSLKWEAQERKGDEEGTWNKLLVEKCLPSCYFRLVSELMELLVDPSTVYSCWPDIERVNGTPWSGILDPFYQLLVSNSKAVNTFGGRWISVRHAVLIIDKVPASVKYAMIKCNANLVEINDSNYEALKQYGSLKTLQPSVVRSYLKSNIHSYCNAPRNEKFEILKYILQDNAFHDIIGLQLLPLADNSFQVFQNKSRYVDDIFVSSSSCPSSLLPGLESQLVSVYNEDSTLHSLLCSVVKSGCTQLVLLDTEQVADLLSKCNTSHWSHDQMSKFWQWLNSEQLTHFQSKPIVPVKCHTGGPSVTALAKQNGVVYISQYTDVPLALLSGLEKCGIRFAHAHEFSHLKHKQLSQYLYQFENDQVLDAIQLSNFDCVSLSSSEAVALQQFLSSFELNDNRVATLCKIPLFKALQHNESSRVSINAIRTSYCDNKAIAMSGTYSFRTDLLTRIPLIIDVTENVLSLIQHLTAHIYLIQEIEYLQKIAFQQICNRQFDNSSIVPFMISVLDNFYTPQYRQAAKQLTSAMSSLPFVPILNSPALETPQDLFDPEIEILRQLYNGERKFPASSFHCYLPILRQCGLKSSVNADEIFEIVSSLRSRASNNSTSCNVGEIKYLRIVSVLKYLFDNPHLFYTIVKYHNNLLNVLHDETSQYCWLPVASNPPSNYPSNLMWKGSQHSTSLVSNDFNPLVVQTQELASSDLPLIAGSQALFVENVPCQLAQGLGSQPSDLVSAVIAHFHEIISLENEIPTDMLHLIAFQTYSYLLQNISYCDSQMFSGKWIWSEALSAFIASTQVAVSANPSFRSNLAPFIFVLPASLQKFSELFIQCGVPVSITSKQIVSVLHSVRDQACGKLSADDAWLIVKSILDWIVEDSNRMSVGDILVPVDSDSNYPQLLPINEVVYTDNEIFCDIANDSDQDYSLIHCKISHLSSKLGLTPLSDHLGITEDVFDDTGQHESLTTRLRNILKDYKDGLTIIKEMIQNADDAGATELNILYDKRTHSKEKLIIKGMADSHGPALIVHNNRAFSKDDFVNITKLAGATKADKPLKIGKFGIGFCSVYHITDVPSFVSGEWLYIFDPTLKYLKGAVCNDSSPGKKMEYRSKFLARSDQLAPYHGLFGFDSSLKYNGTIFRLPFRTNPSQISSTLYSDELVQQIKDDLQDNASKLLLFLQNVKSITFSTVQENGESLCEISIKCNAIESYGIEKRVITVTSLKCKEKIEHWLMSSVKENLEGELAVASVACELLNTDNVYQCQSIKGNVFCFLPLAVSSTGLPVHVSANFAVMSNRSGILTFESVKESSYSKKHWNKQLMTTVIPKTYVLLLKKLFEMHDLNELASYDFFALWPLATCLKAKNPWESLLPDLFYLISQEKLFYSSCTGEWLTLSQSQFFPLSLFQVSRENDPYLFDEVAFMLKLPVVALPKLHLEQLQNIIKINTIITEESFLQLFLNNIELFNKENFSIRNNILFIMLSAFGTGKYEWLKPLLENIQCIPVSPDGLQLKQARQLVDPLSFCSMFDPENGMFPLNSFYKNHLVHIAIVTLGLMERDISWDAIICSAQTIKDLYSREKSKALLRVKDIIKYFKTTRCPVELREIPFLPVLEKPETYILPWKGDSCTVLPPSAVIATTGEDNMWKISFIVGSQKPIVNIQSINKNGCDLIPFHSLELLKISTLPSLNDVLSHFQSLIDLMSEKNSQEFLKMKNVFSHIETICRSVYEFLEIELTNTSHIIAGDIDMPPTATEEILHSYQDKPFVWTGSEFVAPSNVAQNWKTNGPYLYRLPSMISERKRLQKALAIYSDFDINKLLNTLGQMYTQFKQEPLPSNYHEFINTLILELNEAKGKFDDRIDIVLVDHNYILRPSNDLYYNDVSWISAVDDHLYLMHKNLTTSKAESFGIKPVRSNYLDQFDNTLAFAGQEFGQKEVLTDRLKNILRDYPFGITFLKELLQNADDAKASQMRVILDKRQHGKERVLSEKWGKELQGPALLVWNDKDFSDKDLEGIQKLGLGSKQDDDESIGQFGIGFNVVYHVTDCPTFITRGDTLCVFDPLCKYVSGAKATRPGRQYSTNDKFWNDMSDLHSCFLQDDILNELHGLDKGVLFRLPLRTKKQIMESDLIDDKVKTKQLTADTMESYLNEWVAKIKHSLLFLNNVVSFEYFIIDDSNSVSCKQSFAIHLSEDSNHKRVSFKNNLSNFRDSKKPDLVMYSLILESFHHEASTEEEWLIQQGVGDMKDSSRHWNYLKKIIPRHGIAATLERHNDFKGQVFCFLPLPGYTNLPVHINGQFILSSDRHSLWVSESEEPDDKTKWNSSLLQSIFSSYAQFLEQVKPYFTASQGYENIASFYDAVNSYYSLFPFWDPPFYFDKKLEVSVIQPPKKSVNDWKQIGHNVLKLLWFQNPKILTSLRKETRMCYVDWHVLHNDKEPFKQAYFITYRSSIIREILLKLGMFLTCAPHVLFKHLQAILLEEDDSENENPAIVTNESVFRFYRNFHSQIISKCPCSIQDTPFESVKNFIKFFNYMLQKYDKGDEIEYKFPDSPVNIPLLLTADDQLRVFSDSPRTLVSKFTRLFPNSQSQFLHESLISLCPKISPSYFLAPKKVTFTFVDDLLKENVSLELSSFEVDNSNSCVIGLATLWLDEIILTQEELISLWQCLSTDDTFKLHQADVVSKWALIPSISGIYFNASSPIRPIIKPLAKDISSCDVEFCDMLCSFDVPFFDTEIALPSDVEKYCFQLTDADKVLCMLYHIHEQKNIFNLLKSSFPKFQLLLKYLGQINFRNNSESLNYMKSLPVFESIQGDLICISGKDVYTVSVSHDYEVCQAGYSKWATDANIIFLNPSGLWSSFCDMKVFGIESVDKESVFIRFIFPKFSRLNYQERFEQLSHIKDNNFISERDSIIHVPSKFYSELCKLPCIEGKDGKLQPVSYFKDHTIPLFNAFEDHFTFVPSDYQKETWLWFLHTLGLQDTLDKESFKNCCKSLSIKNASEWLMASNMLASYLFSKSAIEWHEDSSFLAEISSISFIIVEPLDNFEWIKMPHKSTGLTSLNEVVLHNYAELVWTVKPVFKLPTEYMESQEYKQHFMEASIFPAENESYCDMTLKKLGVTIKPQVEDVFRNLAYVSETYLSDPSLFSKYDIIITCDQCCLLQSVIVKSFRYLIENSANQFLEQLVTLPCIPVSANNSRNDTVSRPVLVKPIQVVRHISSDHDARNFFPYIISLPSFMEEFGNNLFLIGISESISLKALQQFLEQLKDRKLNTNESIKVREALVKLYKLCKDDSRDEDIITKELSPLYLPNDEGYMKLSTELLFIDLKRYFDSHLNFAGSSYSLFQLPAVPQSSQSKSISERKICLALPEEVRPQGLSLVCQEELLLKSDQTSKFPDLMDHFQNLKSLVPSLQLVLPKAILAHLKIIDSPTVDDTEIDTEIDKFILTLANKFFSDVKVVVIEDLGCYIKLLADEMLIGTINVPFLFQDSTLYVDSNAKPGSKPFCKDMASIMCVEIARMHQVKLTKYLTFLRPITDCLTAQTNDDLNDILEEYDDDADINLISVKKLDSIVRGKEISKEIVRDLEMDINHLFHPEEWVGFEISEGNFVYATILYLIMQNEGNEDIIFQRYKICVSDLSDEKIRDVSIVDLYKLPSFNKKTLKLKCKELILSNVESKAAEISGHMKLEKLKKLISNELERIWMITDQDDKRKATKRMYLKYHPDRVLASEADLYEKAFQFLKEQIEVKESVSIEIEEEQPLHSRMAKSCFSQWDKFAQETFGSSDHHNLKTSDSHSSQNFESSTRPFILPRTNSSEAHRWLKQAETDLLAMSILRRYLPDKFLCCQVLFLAHEACEKTLKAGMYKLFGLNPDSLTNHYLYSHANAIASSKKFAELRELPQLVLSMEKYYLDSRYPNRHSLPLAPVDVYSSTDAIRMAENAERVYDLVVMLFEPKQRLNESMISEQKRKTDVAIQCDLISQPDEEKLRKELQEKIELLEQQLKVKECKDKAVQVDYHIPLTEWHHKRKKLENTCIAGEKEFLLNSDNSSFLKWEEYGLSLFIPKEAVPSSTVKLTVTAIVGGNFVLPENTEFVSAVYAISASQPLSEPVMLKIQHCVSIETSDHINSLSFATASDNQPSPYQFQQIEGGNFSIGERYGCISVTEFSLWSIIMKHLKRLGRTSHNRGPTHSEDPPISASAREEPVLPSHSKSTTEFSLSMENDGSTAQFAAENNLPEKLYFGQVMYETQKAGREWLMRFLLCKDLNALIQYIHDTLKNIRLNSQISFTFDEPSNGFIELSFDACVDFPGWSVREHQSPTKVSQKIIDQYGSLCPPRFPECLITITLTPGSDTLSELNYPVELKGIKSDFQKINIILTKADQFSETHSPKFSVSSDSQSQYFKDVPGVFRKYFAELSEALVLPSNLSAVAMHLYSEKLISFETLTECLYSSKTNHEKSASVMFAIKATIDTKPQSLKTLTGILKKCELTTLATKIDFDCSQCVDMQ